jgi:hypothetical protein
MKVNEYDDVACSLLADAHEIETSKRPAYTSGSADVLANFKSIAARTGATPGQVLTVYMLKHIDAITAALCMPGLPQAESVESRFADAVNYLKLGYALVVEREGSSSGVESDGAPEVATIAGNHFAD